MGTRKILACVLLASCLRLPAQEPKLQDAGSSAATPSAKSISEAPLDPARRMLLSQAIANREYTRAETILVEEINKNPRSPALLTLLARIFFLDGKHLNTAIALKKAEKLAPLDDQSRFTLAMAYIILNHHDWARPELENLAAAEPRNALYPYWLARIDYDAQRFNSAVAGLRKALELDPHFMKAYDNLGLCYEALGNYDEAIRNYQEAIRLNREAQAHSGWPPLNLGALLLKLGRAQEAEAYLREAIENNPKIPQAHFHLGLMLEKQNEDDQALEELRRAAALDPSYPDPHYLMGKIYRKEGDTKNAAAEWKTFEELKKNTPRAVLH